MRHRREVDRLEEEPAWADCKRQVDKMYHRLLLGACRWEWVVSESAMDLEERRVSSWGWEWECGNAREPASDRVQE